jgi:hypothetical protein
LPLEPASFASFAHSYLASSFDRVSYAFPVNHSPTNLAFNLVYSPGQFLSHREPASISHSSVNLSPINLAFHHSQSPRQPPETKRGSLRSKPTQRNNANSGTPEHRTNNQGAGKCSRGDENRG